MMDEYIEREALKNNLHFTKEGIFYHNGKAYMDLNIVDKIVLETPIADVVSVVSCKGCKYFTKEMIAGDLEFICKSAEGMINPAPDKYCSCGTPKERGADE